MGIRAGLAAGILLLGATLLFEKKGPGSVEAWRSPDARVFEARIPPPPADLTTTQAVELAKRNLAEQDRSGEALADARRALAWSKLLNNGLLPGGAGELQNQVEQALEERFQRGQFAYLRAKKTGDKPAAEAAMRMLREAFPYDDPRSLQLDRLERAE